MKAEQRPAVAVIYGFCEGMMLAGELKRALEQNGFIVTRDVAAADIILAHSGGCWLVPSDAQAHIVMLVGVPLWPGRSLSVRMARKIRQDFIAFKRAGRLNAWLTKTLWNGVYFWRLPNTARMFQRRNDRTFASVHTQTVCIVRNRNDTSTPNLHEVVELPHASFVSLPGEHDDIWENPERYVRLLCALY